MRASISIVRTSTTLVVTMGLSKKRKQQLIQMSARAAESHKHRKLDRENERKKRFLKKQREEEDFWDEYEESLLESSSDESNVESSLDVFSSEEGDLGLDNVRGDDVRGDDGRGDDGRGDDGRGDNTLEGLGDNGGVQSEVKENSLRQFGKMTQAVIFEGFKDAVRRLQPNAKKDVNEKWKNRLQDQGRLWVCFLVNIVKINLAVKILQAILRQCPLCLQSSRGKSFKWWKHYLNYELEPYMI